MGPVIVYITAKDKRQATTLARALLEAQLIACANLFDIHSLYRWEGKIEENGECAIIAKSLSRHVPEIIDTVKTLHSYACPCVVSFPITNGHPPFLEWMIQATKA